MTDITLNIQQKNLDHRRIRTLTCLIRSRDRYRDRDAINYFIIYEIFFPCDDIVHLLHMYFYKI
jgi:hypothetical protein